MLAIVCCYLTHDSLPILSFFIAVVQSLGPDRWQELEAAYTTLLNANEVDSPYPTSSVFSSRMCFSSDNISNIQAGVRRSLGHSLHELAQVLGANLSELYLIGAYNVFMQDVDEVCRLIQC